MDFVTIGGFVASFLTIAAYLPQVIKSWKTREVKSLSLRTFMTFCVAATMWITYGVLKKDPVIIVTNSILLCFQLSIVYLKLKGKMANNN